MKQLLTLCTTLVTLSLTAYVYAASEKTTIECENGRTFLKDAKSPIGDCRCPDGQEVKFDLLSDESTFGKCETIQVPRAINNLEFWIDASKTNTLETGGWSCSNTTGTPSNGQDVICWDDISGNNYTLDTSAGTGDYDPTFDTSTSPASVAFDGNTSLFDYKVVQETFSIGTTSGFTYFLVVMVKTLVEGDYIIDIADETSTESAQVQLLTKNNRFAFQIDYNTTSLDNIIETYSPDTITTNQFYIITLMRDPGKHFRIYQNGKLGVLLIDNGDAIDQDRLAIGMQDDLTNGALASHMNLGELIMYDKTLNTTERQNVEQYLADKWGVTLN